MSRHRWRGFSLVVFLGIATWFIYLGLNGRVLARVLPLQYLGYLLAGFVVAGLFGVNIWRGGPLDPMNDQSTGFHGEFRSYRCDICGFAGQLEATCPLDDATCPKCGTLLFPRG
jgi:hypothetical protein